MDAISYSLAAKQAQRIKKFVAEPDTASGLVTVPSVIASGEAVSIPAGRTLVHPNLQVNGTLEIDGTLFIPSGGSVSTTEVDATVVKQNGSVVAIDSAVVHKTGDETIAGVKTFSSSPIVPTPTLADNSTKVATTAFVLANAPVTPDATETTKGKVELATNAEVQAGTDTTRAITPAGMKAGLNASGAAPIYACRAWVNFNGTGTVAIRASGNVSSVTDNGVGNYTVNFTTAMPDSYYSVVGSCEFTTAAVVNPHVHPQTYGTSSVVIQLAGRVNSNYYTDCSLISIAVFI